MHKVLLCHRRPSGMSRAAFQRDWHDRRRPLVLGLQSDLGFHHYTQIHQVSPWNAVYQGTRASRSWAITAPAAALDGRRVPPPWRDDRSFLPRGGWDVIETLAYPADPGPENALASRSAHEALHRLADDQATHAGHTRSLVADSRVPVPAPAASPAPISLLFFLRSWTDVPRDEMLDYWGSQHKALFVSLQEALGYREYEQMHVRSGPTPLSQIEPLGPPPSPPVAGIARITYPDLRTLALRVLSPASLVANARLVRDETTFADMQRSRLVLGREVRFSSSAAPQ